MFKSTAHLLGQAAIARSAHREMHEQALIHKVFSSCFDVTRT